MPLFNSFCVMCESYFVVFSSLHFLGYFFVCDIRDTCGDTV